MDQQENGDIASCPRRPSRFHAAVQSVVLARNPPMTVAQSSRPRIPVHAVAARASRVSPCAPGEAFVLEAGLVLGTGIARIAAEPAGARCWRGWKRRAGISSPGCLSSAGDGCAGQCSPPSPSMPRNMTRRLCPDASTRVSSSKRRLSIFALLSEHPRAATGNWRDRLIVQRKERSWILSVACIVSVHHDRRSTIRVVVGGVTRDSVSYKSLAVAGATVALRVAAALSVGAANRRTVFLQAAIGIVAATLAVANRVIGTALGAADALAIATADIRAP